MNLFETVKVAAQRSNTFDLSCDHKLSLDAGQLIPVHVQEILPGDRVNMSTTTFLRMQPMLAPIMHRADVYIHHFYVPNRVLWPQWEEFINATVESPPIAPYLQVNSVQSWNIGHYLGLPIGVYAPNSLKVSALIPAAYAKIRDDYYRDQNLQQEVFQPCIEGDNGALYGDFIHGAPYRRAWRKDYFTSALPFAQAGAAITIPLGSSAEIKWKGSDAFDGAIVKEGDGLNPYTGAQRELGADAAGVMNDANDAAEKLTIDNAKYLEADLTTAEAATVNEWRRAFALQRWAERLARGGQRYFEQLWAQWGVKSPDARLQRAEYLGGGMVPISISEVLQNSGTPSEGSETPQGTMAGHGISVGASNRFSKSFVEHGIMMTIMSILPRAAYQQGLHRHWFKWDKFDYATPDLAHIGEQEIRVQELYAELPTDDERNAVFGYTPRYAEYHFNNSRVSGELATNLNFWHWGRIFENEPALNSDFIQCDPGKRIFAVESDEYNSLIAHCFHDIKVRRKLPKFGIPF